VPSSTVTEQPPPPVLITEPSTVTIVADDAAALPWLIALAPEFHWPAHSDRLAGIWARHSCDEEAGSQDH
jgi:hypothetical protein